METVDETENRIEKERLAVFESAKQTNNSNNTHKFNIFHFCQRSFHG